MMYRLPNVSLFGSGVYRGQQWPASSIVKMAENAAKLAPKLFVAPAVGIGHDSDITPAAGWILPSSVHAIPDADNPGEQLLRGDVVNVPESVAAQVRSGQYAYGSAEIYSNFVDDFGNSHGPVLRRFVFLGASPPQVKRLGRLPMPEPMATPIAFAERLTGQQLRPRQGLAVLSFADRDPTLPPAAAAEVAKVAKYAEQHAAGFRKAGFDPARLVAGARAAASRNPMMFKAGEIIGRVAEQPEPGPRPSRLQLIAAIKKAFTKVSQATLDKLSDDQLCEFVASIPAA